MFFSLAPTAGNGNNGTFEVLSVNAAGTSALIRNAQAVVEGSSLYWQETFEQSYIRFTSGPAAVAGNRRPISKHGAVAVGSVTITSIPADTTNTLTLNDGTNAPTVFTWKTVPVAATDVLRGATIAESAANLRAAINAQAPTTLRIRATNTVGQTAVQLRNMVPGATGVSSTNVAIAQGGAAYATLVGMAGGIGDPLKSFKVTAVFSPVPVATNTFVIEKESVIFTTSGTLLFAGPANIFFGIGGVRFLATGVAAAPFGITGPAPHFNCSTFDLAGGQFSGTNFSTFNATSTPWAADPTSTLVGTNFVALRSGTLSPANSRLLGRHSWRQVVCGNATNGSSEMNIQPDAERSTIQLSKNDSISIVATAATPSRMDGTFSSVDTGLIQLSNQSVSSTFTFLQLLNSAGAGLDLSKGGLATLASVTGAGNATAGVRCKDKSCVIADTLSTVHGNTADLSVGQAAPRDWTHFNATAPIGMEHDVTGDGSMVKTAAATAFGLKQIVSGGAVPTVAAGTGAGAAPTSLTITGDNTNGTVTLITNVADTPAASATIFTMTFALPGYPAGTTPRVQWEAANDAAADLAYGVWRARQADTTVLLTTLRSGATPLPALTAATYVWTYHVLTR
jgi:hypothetical protein